MGMVMKVNCGNWFKGWGFGLTNKLGKLESDDLVTFVWKGHSQGRHGAKWNRGANCEFTLSEDGTRNRVSDKVVLEFKSQEGGIPDKQSLLEGVRDLQDVFWAAEVNKAQRVERQAVKEAKAKAKALVNKVQTKLF
jgi:hypothetical protein